MSKERIEYVDLLKGLAILLVVIGHIYNFQTVAPQNNWVFKLIYSFHLPLFFILSGYIGKITPPTKASHYVIKKFRSLMLPYIFVGSIFILFIKNGPLLSIENRSEYWFILDLFIINMPIAFSVMLKPLLSKQIIKDSIVLTIYYVLSLLLIALLFKGLSWNPFRMTIYYYPYYFLGYYISHSSIQKILSSERVMFAITLIFVILFYLNLNYGRSCSIPLSIINYSLGFSGSLALLGFMKQNSENLNKYISRSLSLIGKKSLSIYVFHYFFLFGIPVLDCQWLFGIKVWYLEFCITLLLALLIVVGCLILEYCVSQNKYFNLLLLGRYDSTNTAKK